MPTCPKCGSRDCRPCGSEARPGRFQCSQCQKYFTDPGAPKVLVIDIETLPCVGTMWGTGKQYIGYENILLDYVILSWSAKWLYGPTTMHDILTPDEAQARWSSLQTGQPNDADKRILQRVWTLLDEADFVIHQNGRRFDVPRLNYRFLWHGIPPYHPFQQIDTYETASKVFSPTSAKQDFMLRELGLGSKLDTDYQLWLKCQRGDPKALKEMMTYNIHDVDTLEMYYSTIRAWVPNHPNFSVFSNKYVNMAAGEVQCHVCRQPVTKADFGTKFYTSIGYWYESFRCPHCGAIGRRQTRNEGIARGQKVHVRNSGS